MALSQPALAQEDEDTQDQTGDEVDAGPVADSEPTQPGIVVTGSRIVRQDFEANSPFVTVDEALLENTGTAALEQSLNKLPQFVPAQTPTMGGDIQPTATNTPGAATVSLRGIGSNRNLVLLDGRRATPSNASGVVDISTIPAAAIERIEVISGGASATYGADAVAGVTNFILKKNFQGLELDAQAGLSEAGDGFEYQVSGIMGADFADGRGNVSIALSTNKREASFQRDNEFYRDLWADTSTTSGSQFFIENPGVSVGFNPPSVAAVNQVMPGANPPIPAPAFFQTFYTNQDGSVFTNGFGARGGVAFFNTPNDEDSLYKITDAGTLSQINTGFYQILPLTRYNMFMRGNYEINDWIGVFAQGLYSHVSTATRNEPGPIIGGWGVSIDPTVLDRDQLPDELWTLLDSRAAPDAPFDMTTLMPDERETFTDVDTYNLTAGLEGSIPGSDWTWEAFAQFGETTTYAKQTGVYSLERVRAVMTAPNFGEGFSRQGNAAYGGFGASSATCTSGLNFFRPPPGGFSEDCLEAIRADLKNRSKMQQNIWEANLQGGLFDLPAGSVRAAIGASYRELDYVFDNDTLTTQGRSFNDQALGIYPSGNVDAGFDVKEVYAETLIPILADTFVNAFNLELGARASDYSTTGTSYTYKILGDLEVTNWLRFRGGYNKAERAPNIGELFLAAQQTFGFNNVGDLCSKRNPAPFSANEAVNPNGAEVEAVCRVLMDQSGDPTADDEYYDLVNGVYVNGAGSTASSGFAFPTTVGNENLTPETAKTWTAGVVLSSPFTSPFLDRFRLSVDWFNIRVDDAIGVQSVGVAQRQCLQPEFNPLVLTDPVAAANSPFCQNITRNQQAGTLGNVFVTYVNNARFEVEGVDFQLDWGMDVGPGTLSVNALVNWLRKFEIAELPTDEMVDYAGTLGTNLAGVNQGAFEYRILGTANYVVGPARIGLQWQHLPSVEDSTEALFPTPTEGAPAYNIFHLNGGYALTDNVNLRFGVENLFDKAPPYVNRNPANNQPAVDGNLPGGGYNAQFYDTIGRRFYVGANLKF
jgi:outer membrane receptor protein involved in Fe transport